MYCCGVLAGCGKLYDVFLGGQGTMLQLGRAARTAALFLPGEPPVEVVQLSQDRGTAGARCRACIDNLYNPSIRASSLLKVAMPVLQCALLDFYCKRTIVGAFNQERVLI